MLRPFVKLQAKSIDQELTLFYPCHKKKRKNNKNNKHRPPQKSLKRGCTRGLKFEGKTTHGLSIEFRWLGVHVTRITRTKKISDPKFFSAPNFFRAQNFLDPKFFWTQLFFGPKTFPGPKFFSGPNFFSRPKIFF